MDFDEGLKKVNEANQQIVDANSTVTDVIMSTFIFTWRWWFGVALIVLPWVTWFIFRDRKSTGRLLCAGFFVMIFSAVLDTLGIEFGLWSYPVKVVPSPTLSFSFRLSVLPVFAMFFIQIKPKVIAIIKAIIYAGVSAYIGMPILASIQMYKKLNWAYTYSFFILSSMYLIAHWLYNLQSYEKVQTNPTLKIININTNFFRRKQKSR
ncbi:CBO0543 family protein [Gorillibacterium sp. sgz5001074]|uniref:CBO0543 family protein n=1 Tax=Gorillibacterium sp. sgz5001074 TaxID=3446695 RepID=UPI003F678DE1